jgi:hypothetical protein
MICITGNANMPRSGVPRMSLAFESSLGRIHLLGRPSSDGASARRVAISFFECRSAGWCTATDG